MGYSVFVAKSTTGGADLFLKHAPTFYNTFPHDHRIEINIPANVLAQNTFLSLFKGITDCNNRDILLVAHGTKERGIFLGFGTGRPFFSYQVIFYIFLYKKLTKLFNQISLKRNPEEWVEIFRFIRPDKGYNLSNPANALKELKTLLNQPAGTEKYDSAIKRVRKYKKLSEGTEEEQSIKKQVRENIINDFILEIKFYINGFFRLLSMPKERLDTYIEYIEKIHLLKLNNLAIRGCNIGKDEALMEIYRLLFNVQNINAPNVRINYGLAAINIRSEEKTLHKAMRTDVRSEVGARITPKKWIGGPTDYLSGPKNKKGRSAIYYHPEKKEKDKDELLLTVRRIGRRNIWTKLVAEDLDVALEFAREKFGEFAPDKKNLYKVPTKGKLLEIPICVLETFPLRFPQDAEFGEYLKPPPMK
jgi:hypothetical protein